MKKINWFKVILVLAIVSWLGLFGADKLFGLTFALAGAVGFGLIYLALFSGVAWLAQNPAQAKA